jgi:hypothetical protein
VKTDQKRPQEHQNQTEINLSAHPACPQSTARLHHAQINRFFEASDLPHGEQNAIKLF